MTFRSLTFLSLFAVAWGTGALAAPADELIKQELSKRFPGARIEIVGEPRWVRGEAPAEVYAVGILEDNARGEAHFSAQTKAKTSHEGWISFAAWMPAHVASRRIHPGERLSGGLFSAREVNVATGQSREYRGVILSVESDLSGLEARQSILEGQVALMTAVQRVPDVRRGDTVKVVLSSGELSLSTTATASEAAYLDGPVRVLTAKTKRELTGRLVAGGIVEVRL